MLVFVVYWLLFLMLVPFVHGQGKAFYERRMKLGKTQPKVFDIGHMLLPNWSRAQDGWVRDVHRIAPFVVPWVFGAETGLYHMKVSSVVMLIRLLFTMATVLPKDASCDESKETWASYLFGRCYDKSFSSLFAVTMTGSFVLFSTGHVTSIPLLAAYNLLNAFLLLAYRYHYTVDLLTAMVVSALVFQNKALFM